MNLILNDFIVLSYFIISFDNKIFDTYRRFCHREKRTSSLIKISMLCLIKKSSTFEKWINLITLKTYC
ncbi:hypothetical protein BpHYR1_038837 [Brachionus plicatilis]|uniref:Uncharacterized protein n=1 Tax=Brachionus plicatilis TaxID=10195 RepID=A0A3M7SAH0_BRAPC|nr:hypothetical protein BpHYR1_038837 [Brachionus plicatilis]